jgi:acyl dehydratase
MERYFDDFSVGERMDAGSYTISLDEIKEFAARYDPQSFHLDEAATARSPFKRLVASGWHTAALAMKLAVESGVMKATGILGVGVDELRWPKPVYPGDTLRLVLEVVEKKPSAPGSHRGVMRMRLSLFNQDYELVFTEVPTLLVARKCLM